MIVYFSGTGNSRYCAQYLAAITDDTLLDSHNYIKDQIAPGLISSQPWVFVCPTYAWQIPRIFEKFLRSGGCFSGSRDAYFVMTCGDSIGNAAKYNETLCKDLGFHHKGTLQVIMPENYVAMFPVPNTEESQKIISAANPILEEAAQRILRGEDFLPCKVSLGARFSSSIVNKAFYPLCVSAKKFYATDSCISCGKCAELCPLNNITLKDGKPIWGKDCTHCMACICRCPAEAIEYGRISKGKRRYQCPEYTKE